MICRLIDNILKFIINAERRKLMRITLIIAFFASVILSLGIADALETHLVIRAKSKDAKFVGTRMGAHVVVRDSESGRVLAEGVTSGGTGDTGTIMIKPKTRFGAIAGGAAKFETSIDIDEPRLVTIEVQAPSVSKGNMIKSTTQMWVIPGKDITGEGIIIEVPGFAVDAQMP
jgi:hypothetical protein